jgi:hypothetical protein
VELDLEDRNAQGHSLGRRLAMPNDCCAQDPPGRSLQLRWQNLPGDEIADGLNESIWLVYEGHMTAFRQDHQF